MLMRDFQSGVRELAGSSASLDEKSRTFVRLVSGFLGGPPVTLFLADRDGAGFTLSASSSAWRCDHGEIWFDAAATIDALALEEERVVHLTEPEVRPPEGRRQAEHLVFPLVAHGERAGVLTVERVASRRISEGRRLVLAEAIRQFSELLVTEIRIDRLSKKLTRITSLQEVGVTLLSTSGVGELVRSAAFSAAFVLEAEASVVRLYDPRTRRYAILETHGLPQGDFRDRALALEEQASASVLQGGGAVLVSDVEGDRRFGGFADAVRDFVCHPLGDREGRSGAVTVMNKLPSNGVRRSALGEEDLGLLAHLARYIHGAARTTFLLAAKERARGYDPLTGLLSLRTFQSLVAAEIRRAQRFGTRFLLLACDITPLESAGPHPAVLDGAEFFRTVARRIRGAFREYDHVARAGKARFVVILPEVHDAMTGAARRVEVAVGAEKDRLRRLGRELRIEISFTHALFPDDGDTFEALARAVGLAAPRG